MHLHEHASVWSWGSCGHSTHSGEIHDCAGQDGGNKGRRPPCRRERKQSLKGQLGDLQGACRSLCGLSRDSDTAEIFNITSVAVLVDFASTVELRATVLMIQHHFEF